MEHIVITPKSPGGFVRCLSGLFITKENPPGLTPTELTVLATLFAVLQQHKATTIDKEIRKELATAMNSGLQTAVNYVNKFKKKGVVLNNNTLHPIFYKTKITIEWTK